MSLHVQVDARAVIDLSATEVLGGLESLGVSVLVTNADGTILAWNDSSSALLGRSAADVLGHQVADVMPMDLRESGLYDIVGRSGDRMRIQVLAVPAGPNRDLVLSLAIPADGDASVAPSGDMNDRLTDLRNRAYLTGRLSQWRSAGQPIAVLFLDIDHFKLVNDNRGHATGDRLLKAIAGRLTSTCRADDLVARLGDDEFVVVRRDADVAQARRLAGDICRMLDDPFAVGDAPVAVSVSIGVATTEDVEAGDLLQAAERALHYAKAAGRGRVEVHDASMRCSTKGRLQLLADLRQAIKTDSLALHYQPTVHTNGRVVGVEALLRWSHPRLGAIPPSDIIPLAEDNGLMPALGEWILRRACSDIAQSRDPAIASLHVAVNLSTRQLADPGIVDTVRRALDQARLPAERLVLEVTETSVIANPETTTRQLQALKALGVRLALDDFGTGYSSLVHVRRFPIDIIKIDRAFIAGMTTNSDDCAIVASLTSLAGAVGLEVVAEGVETPAQADLLRRLGCTYTQGYLWSPAVPVSELAAIVQRGFVRGPADGSRSVGTSSSPGRTSDRSGRILAMYRSGASPNTIAAALNSEGERTPLGARWHATTVARAILESGIPSAPPRTG
jgi:diguanylate cyclase (GGDEF)-like protein